MSDRLACMRGERIYLRPMTTDDRERFVQWFYDTDPYSQSPGVFHYRSVKDLQEWLEPHGDGQFIVMTGEHDAVGYVRYHNLNYRNRSAEVGALINPNFSKQGFATEAMTLLLDLLFNEFGMNKVHLQLAAFNERAISLVERLGFQKDGVLRQHYFHHGSFHDGVVYSFLSAEWKESREANKG